MVNQNKIFSFEIKCQAKNLFPRDVERTVVEIGHEIISVGILPVPLIQEGQSSLLPKVCAQGLVHCLED